MLSYLCLIPYAFFTILLKEYAVGTLQFDSKSDECVKVNHETITCNFIPNSLPFGVTKIHLNLDMREEVDLKNSTFIDSSWDNVNFLRIDANLSPTSCHLNLQDNCFNGLDKLRELRLHTTCSFNLNPVTFLGLNDVEVLDFSRNNKFVLKDFISAINGSDKIPQLNTLILSNCSSYYSPLDLDDQVIKVIQSKKIKNVDLSNTDLIRINLTAIFKRLVNLEVVDISYCTVGYLIDAQLNQNDIEQRLKFLDISFAILPKKAISVPPGRFVVTNKNAIFSKDINVRSIMLLFSFEIVNMSSIIPHVSSIWIKNGTVTLESNPSILTRKLKLRKNNLRWLDIRVNCERFCISSVTHIDLSENGMQFLHPNLLSCCPNLQNVDLSNNQLVNMYHEDTILFENLFSGLRFVKHIYLSKNNLRTIPIKMFENNMDIEVIDLSGNILDQVHFILAKLSKLRILNLRGNNIHFLDQKSIHNLNSFPYHNLAYIRKNIVFLKSNPISCSICEARLFLVWLTSTDLVDLDSQQLICYNENSVAEEITKLSVKKVEFICRRKVIKIVLSVAAGTIFFVIVITLLIIFIRRNHRNKLQKRENAVHLLHQGDGIHEFAVFLAFSYEDEDFVNANIQHQLNENLQLMTGVDRELVCTGDRHFRPGFYVHTETCRRLDTASVLIVVASKNFCQSVYCNGELEQAFKKNKPIILMFIELIEREVMSTTMRELYDRNVRIVWTKENGEYRMKTTWDNVCTSVLKLIK